MERCTGVLISSNGCEEGRSYSIGDIIVGSSSLSKLEMLAHRSKGDELALTSGKIASKSKALEGGAREKTSFEANAGRIVAAGEWPAGAVLCGRGDSRLANSGGADGFGHSGCAGGGGQTEGATTAGASTAGAKVEGTAGGQKLGLGVE